MGFLKGKYFVLASKIIKAKHWKKSELHSNVKGVREEEGEGGRESNRLLSRRR